MALTRRCQSADHIFPLNEEAVLALTHPHGTYLQAREGLGLVGYAWVHQGAAQMAVDPDHRRRGIGSLILTHVPPGTDLWAFGDLAQGFCAEHGFEPQRGLLVMEAPPSPPTPHPAHPGVEIRCFREQDLPDLTRLNARAFSAHDEQGFLTEEDLRARMDCDWFDPDGLFIAWADGAMAGFHWTKVQDVTGEVYVLGVDPAYAGHGIGRILLDAGLNYLYRRQVSVIRLWVELDNIIAQNLYATSGFCVVRRDLRYRKGRES